MQFEVSMLQLASLLNTVMHLRFSLRSWGLPFTIAEVFLYRLSPQAWWLLWTLLENCCDWAWVFKKRIYHRWIDNARATWHKQQAIPWVSKQACLSYLHGRKSVNIACILRTTEFATVFMTLLAHSLSGLCKLSLWIMYQTCFVTNRLRILSDFISAFVDPFVHFSLPSQFPLT